MLHLRSVLMLQASATGPTLGHCQACCCSNSTSSQFLQPLSRWLATSVAASPAVAPAPSGSDRSKGSGPQQQQKTDWTEHTRKRFTIKPSVLSPLYATYTQEQSREAQRNLLTQLISAHTLLAQDIDGFDPSQASGPGRGQGQSLHAGTGRGAQALRALLTPRSCRPVHHVSATCGCR